MKTRVFNYGQLLSLVFCLSVTACNKEDYYQKEFLDNPYQENPKTDGPVDDGNAQGGADSGMEGGTQGGVDSGVGGTTGSTTAGSTTGGTDGGVDGTTAGGSTGGETTGGTDGSVTGGSSTGGSTTGGTDGSTTGGTDGSVTGGTTGGSTTGGTTGGSTTGGTTGGSTTGGTTGGAEVVPQTDTFQQTSSQTKKIDIVWIVDNSGSMADEQDELGANFNAFIRDFITKDVDFKMAVTTTDARSDYKGLMVPGSATKLTSAAAAANEDRFMDDFRRLVKVGTSGSGSEKGLEASEGFMIRYADSFLRSDAYLAVVVLSDEEDQSAKTVGFYTDYLKSFKNEPGLVKVYSIVDVTRSNRGSGITTGYERYAQASGNTNGTVSDIRASFHGSLSAMGDSLINLLDSFALSHRPVDDSLKVFVSGTLTTNYSYDATSNSIKFDAGHLPAVGQEIRVEYLRQ